MATLSTKIRDSSWLRQVFVIPSKNGVSLSDDIDKRNAQFSTARFKFANTSLGGSLAINPPPQYTPTADRRVAGIGQMVNVNNEPELWNNTGSMGRYYSEAVDDNSRVISMRFGVPQFNSLSTFFTGFYNYNAGLLARTGRASGAFYMLGKIVGYVVPLIAWPLFVINLGSDIVKFFTQTPRSKYYYLKPTMPLYWNAVTSLVNQLAVNKGVIPHVLDDDQKKLLGDNRWPFTGEELKNMSKLMGDILMEDGQINVYAMATRYQRSARQMYKYMMKTYNDDETYKSMFDIVNDIYTGTKSINWINQPNPSFKEYLGKWTSVAQAKPKQAETVDSTGNTASPTTTDSKTQASGTTVSADTEGPIPDSDVDGLVKFWAAELDDGSQFVSFRVDNDSTASESFSNQTGESEIATKINQMSGSSRETVFNLAGGNIGGGALGSLAQAGLGAVKDFIGGVADGLQMSGIAALGGAAFVDIPKHWTASSAQLPRMNYTMTLSSPYGNKMSQLMFMYVPLCMIIAASIPISTGKQSYTSPFLCELFDRGRAQTRLGIIDSLSITRGTTHLGFNNSGNAMGIDVSFSVQDLSSVMHMPLIQGFLPGSGAGIFDDDTVFTDYMAILGSLTVNEQTYPLEKLKLRLTKTMSDVNTWFSSAHFAQWATDLTPFQLVSAFMPGRVNR